MSIFWFITTLLLLHSCTPGVGMDHDIVNGEKSIPHSRPYMVYIYDKQRRAACGGFLVREDFVLTAAHCKTNHLKVYLGVDDTNHLPEGIEVDAFPHESFVNKKPGDDIMLLKLKTPATLNKTVKIIALPETNREKIPSNCMAMGWGWKEHNEFTPSSVLREVNLTLLDSENCAIPHTICTQEKAGPTQGDSGGPLICGNVPQGIVSYYIPNESTRFLTMYTKISHYLPWIHKIMNAPL
ncbi:granzyme G-like [Paramisgurnus dabryanus]|uniref:granzyme G-like n=1 Tax=Paramisgurnus dabryanus TaxID=90735 RepID=UPI0031F3A87E